MKNTIIVIAAAAAVAVGGFFLMGLDPAETFKFIAAMFNGAQV